MWLRFWNLGNDELYDSANIILMLYMSMASKNWHLSAKWHLTMFSWTLYSLLLIWGTFLIITTIYFSDAVKIVQSGFKRQPEGHIKIRGLTVIKYFFHFLIINKSEQLMFKCSQDFYQHNIHTMYIYFMIRLRRTVLLLPILSGW